LLAWRRLRGSGRDPRRRRAFGELFLVTLSGLRLPSFPGTREISPMTMREQRRCHGVVVTRAVAELSVIGTAADPNHSCSIGIQAFASPIFVSN
jgi:hypothetical protein